jgi:hypothetical protein
MEDIKKELSQLYEVEQRSMSEIGKIYGKDAKWVSRRIKMYGIKARSFSTKGLHPGLGRHLSDETKQKLSEARKGKKLSPEHREKVIKTLSSYYNDQRGDKNPCWKGGKHVSDQGYVRIRINGEYVFEHRYIMEQHLGRRLTDSEVVHHKNHVRNDNRIDNLMILGSNEHSELHWSDEEARKKQSDGMKLIRKNKFWSTKAK